MTDEGLRSSLISSLYPMDKPFNGGKEAYKKWHVLEVHRCYVSVAESTNSSLWFFRKNAVTLHEDFNTPFLIQKIRAVPEAIIKTKKQSLLDKLERGPLLCNLVAVGLNGSGKHSIASTLGFSYPYDPHKKLSSNLNLFSPHSNHRVFIKFDFHFRSLRR